MALTIRTKGMTNMNESSISLGKLKLNRRRNASVIENKQINESITKTIHLGVCDLENINKFFANSNKVKYYSKL